MTTPPPPKPDTATKGTEPTIVHPKDGELLPCPFCGSPAGFEHDNNSAGQWHVFCRDNQAEAGCTIGLTNSDGYPRRVDAAAAWNRRAPAVASAQQGQPSEIIKTLNAKLKEAFDEIARLRTSSQPAQEAPDDLTEALCRVIDGWRKEHPDLTYYETVTVIEGLARLLSNLRDEAAGRPLATVIPFGAASSQKVENDELEEWKQVASVEAGLRREFLARAEAAELVLKVIHDNPATPLTIVSLIETEAPLCLQEETK